MLRRAKRVAPKRCTPLVLDSSATMTPFGKRRANGVGERLRREFAVGRTGRSPGARARSGRVQRLGERGERLVGVLPGGDEVDDLAASGTRRLASPG